MKKVSFLISFLLLAFACSNKEGTVLNDDFNASWKFALSGDSLAFQSDYDDTAWRTLDLPHDWSVEFPFDTVNGEGCTGYLPGGIGWYRKSFDFEVSDDKKVEILFDGVYNHSEIWINDTYLGYHPYGYSPFHFDLTPYLNKDGKNNVIAVKVDRSRYADSRWYTGSGIYRNVKLVVSDKLNIPIWGTFITTPEISEDLATISVKIKVNNSYKINKSAKLVTKILDASGSVIKTHERDIAALSGETKEFSQKVEIVNPQLWDTHEPYLYKAVSEIRIDGITVDIDETTFGIRSIEFNADKGFFLNDKNMKIKGVCLHHDGGIVGAAVPKGVWKRRLQTLKDGGCNAIRISHNPASEEFLELCDEMGFLVQDEFFDEWDYPKDKRMNMNERHDDYITRGSAEYFQEWAERDLKATLQAHKNHPSVFQWSIGNEIEWTYPRNKKSAGFWDANWSGNYFWSPTPLTPDQIEKRYNEMEALQYNIGETAQKLSKWTKELDTTRPVVANCILPSASYVTGYADALDVIGFSYRRVMYDYGHKHFPDKPLMGTENLPQWHEWKAIEERDHVSGTFLWTGIDYMGEANHWPGNKRRKGTHSGLLDYAGFKKPAYYMYKTLWNKEEPTIKLYTQTSSKSQYKVKGSKVVEKKPGTWKQRLWYWYDVNEHWNYSANEQVIVEVISNCPEVELFLDGKSLGKKKLIDFEDRIYKWPVPFKSGKLEAKGTFMGVKVSDKIATNGEPTSIILTVDKNELKANGYDVAHIVAQLVDKDGNPVISENETVTFNIEGAVKSLGVDNGWTHSLQTYQSDKIETYKGRTLLIVKSLKSAGAASIKATANGIESNVINLTTK